MNPEDRPAADPEPGIPAPPGLLPSPSPRSRRRRPAVLALALALAFTFAGIDAWLCPRWPRCLERWPPPDSGFSRWESLAPGIDYARSFRTRPRPMRCHAVRIDLHHPGVRLTLAADPDGDGNLIARWPTSFLRRHDLEVAINATPFQPDVVLPGRSVKPTGRVVVDGQPISPPAPNLDALVVEPGTPPRLQRSQRDEPTRGLVAGGFVVTLADGVNRGETGLLDAVTSVGLSSDRRWMYWLVVDGRQAGYSDGAKGNEAADLMTELGAHDAMLLDGGGSTSLVARGGWAGARVLNRPRSPVISGLQRPVACVLGVRGS